MVKAFEHLALRKLFWFWFSTDCYDVSATIEEVKVINSVSDLSRIQVRKEKL